MAESQLIKEFNNRDVQRMRNIITKNYNDKTITQVGYQKTNVIRVENEIWEENGRKWIMKNGIKQTLTRFDELKKMLVLPLTCPQCGKPMNNSVANKKLYSIHSKCMDCVIKHETELKRDGTYKEYEDNIRKDQINGYLKDLESAFFDTFINNSNESIISENGDIEQWVGGYVDKEALLKKFQDEIKEIKENINL